MGGLPDPRLPAGPLAGAWSRTRENLPLISPLRKRQLHVLVVGSGLAGASAAATLAEQGYRVTVLTYHDSPRRAHSVAAQGVSMRPKTTLAMATAWSACLPTPCAAATSAHVRPAACAWPN